LLQAQSVPKSALEACGERETDALKLACFEKLLADERPALAAEAPAEAPAEAKAAAPAVSAEPASDDAADSFGSEHLGNEESASLQARVAEVTEDSFGALIFHLDNGQVWRQLEKRYYPYPRNRAFDVVISQGILGGYQLQVDGAGRKVTVRRIK